jgi:hypothetical protein
MSLASELSESSALERIQSRVQAYWDRQWEKRLIASLRGVLPSNVANNGGDMVNDVHSLAGTVTLPGMNVTVLSNAFNGLSVISTALTVSAGSPIVIKTGTGSAVISHGWRCTAGRCGRQGRGFWRCAIQSIGRRGFASGFRMPLSFRREPLRCTLQKANGTTMQASLPFCFARNRHTSFNLLLLKCSHWI